MPASAGDASARGVAEALDEVEDAQDLGAVADHLPVTRLPPAKHAVPVHHEGGAVGHVAFLVQHAVSADGLAVDVAQKGEREARGLGEGLVAEGTIPADGHEYRAAILEPARDLSQAGELRRSDPAPVVAVERDDDIRPALELLEGDRPAERRGQRESGRRLAPSERDHGASLSCPGAEGNCCRRHRRARPRDRRRASRRERLSISRNGVVAMPRMLVRLRALT